MESETKPQKFRLKDAAKEIGISLTTLKLKIKRREIGCEELGPRTKNIYQSEIDAYKQRAQERPIAI